MALSEVESWNIGRLSHLALPYPGHRSQHQHLLVLWWSRAQRCSWSATVVYLDVLVSYQQQCHPSPLSRYWNLTPYQTDPLMQSGRHHEIPVILSPDDLHPRDAPIRPSPASHGEHTNPVVYRCWAEWVSPYDLVLCFGCSGLSHLLGILPAFFLVVSSETSGQNSGLHGTRTPSHS